MKIDELERQIDEIDEQTDRILEILDLLTEKRTRLWNEWNKARGIRNELQMDRIQNRRQGSLQVQH